MKQTKATIKLLLALALTAGCTKACIANEDSWFDPYYQYRIPVTIDVKTAGWNIVPIDESDIIDAINKIDEFQLDPLWFAYNHLKVVEVGEKNKTSNMPQTAGFYIVFDSEELVTKPLTEINQRFEIPTEAGAYYLVRYTAAGGGRSPLMHYAQIHPIGSKKRSNDYLSSYEPELLPKKLTAHERLLISDGNPLLIDLKKARVAKVQSVSVKKIKIRFLANVRSSGTKQWMLYYQPMCSNHLMIPQLRADKTPSELAKASRTGTVEKNTTNTQYRLYSDDRVDMWFAETSVKLTLRTPVPKDSSDSINISCAKNETQSFQLVIRPKKPLTFEKLKVGDLQSARCTMIGSPIGPKNFGIYALEYVPINKRSFITPATCLGSIGDPLVDVSSVKLSPTSGNYTLWINVTVPAKTAAGDYHGKITVVTDSEVPTIIPLNMHVYDFELPEFSTFRSSVGGQFFALPGRGGKKTFMDYHGLSTKGELKKLVRKYYDLMAINKFYPKTVTMYSDIGLNWSPPPQGYNVDQPGNYFSLYDWDFKEFNRELGHYIDDLKVNSVCLTNTNPITCNVFKHLPGAERDTFDTSAPHVTMAWQAFRDSTYVTWGKQEGDLYSEKSIEITRDQFDHLILDYYRKIAENLEKNGWLDKFYIYFDLTPDMPRMLHFLRVLKSDPLTAKIKIVALTQDLRYLYYKEQPDDASYTFNGLITYLPEIDERYNRWERYYFKDYDIVPERANLWQRAVYSGRMVIDAPGINNRIIGLDLFNRGGSGYFNWDSFLWDSIHCDSQNPWENPYTRFGNGALAYFYPPDKKGLSPKPTYKVVPSLRIMTFREGVDDYEYARILEDLICKAERMGVNATKGKTVIKDIERFFYSSVHWSQNDDWYLKLRDRMANSIVELRKTLYK